jgi:hypothetical protein
LVPKKENQANVNVLNKPSGSGSGGSPGSGSKLKTPKSTLTFERLTFATPTASSSAKLVKPANAKAPLPTVLPKKEKAEQGSSTTLGQSSKGSLSKIFKSKKKVQKKVKGKKSSEKKPGSV